MIAVATFMASSPSFLNTAFAADGQERIIYDQNGIDAQVREALDNTLMLYDEHGQEAFEMITDSRTSFDTLLVLVVDKESRKVLASPTPGFVGTSVFTPGIGSEQILLGNINVRFDRTFNGETDIPFEQLVMDLETNTEAWVKYITIHPSTGQNMVVRLLLHLHEDGLIFSSGYFLADFEVQNLVESTVQRYEAEGVGAFAAGMITPHETVITDELYPFVIDFESWTRVADGVVPDRVGQPERILDTAARSVEDVHAELRDTGSAWVSYTFHNPSTDITQLKYTWLYLHEGYVFGSGYYPTDYSARGPAEGSMLLYDAHGTDAFTMMTPDSFDPLSTRSYFVLDAETQKVVAHGRLPMQVGEKYVHFEAADKSPEVILAELQNAGTDGVWIWHMDLNPATRTQQLTHTYLALYGDYIFGASISLPDIRVQSTVDDAVYAYNNNPEKAITIINSGELNRLDVSPIIRNETHILADGAAPQRVGPVPPSNVLKNQLPLRFIPDGVSLWGEFAAFNPDTGTTQITRSWSTINDGYLFLAQYSVADADTQSATDYARFVYESNRENDAWRDIITPDEPVVTSELYPFVIDAESWTRLADGVVPGRVGEPETILDTSARSVDDVLAELNEAGSLWVNYIFHNPATGVEQLKRTYLQLKDGLVFGSGYYILESEAQARVFASVIGYDSVGRDRTLALIDRVPAVPATTYNFVVNPTTGETLAQGIDLPGGVTDWESITGVVPAQEIIDTVTVQPGMWVSYIHQNPASGEAENKHTWLVLHKGLLFGSGYYTSEIPESDVKFAVQNAINVYRDANRTGEDWAGIITPDEPITTDALYPFVIDAESWTRLADGVVPGRVGQPETILDTSTRSVDDVLAELNEVGSLWVNYIFHNPATGIEQLKRTYLELHDGLVFGSGYYVLDSKVQSLVHNRILEYERDYRNATIQSIGMVPPIPITTYAFAVDPTSGITLAQNVNSSVVGTMTDWDAITDTYPESDVLENLDRGSGDWISYTHISPITGESELKHTWLVLHDGLVFGAGYYSTDILETDVKFEVRGAIDIYDNNKADDAWRDIITPDRQLTTDALYPFVIDAESWTRLADGVVPDRVDQREIILDTSFRTPEDVLVELHDRGSLWVSYIFHNPATNVEQLKRSYLQLHDGLVFGSGYYILESNVQSLTHSLVLEYERDGRAAVIDSVNTGVSDPHYSFVADSVLDETLAQGIDPTSIGEMTDWSAIIQAVSKQDLLDELNRGSGVWVGYNHTYPGTDRQETKRTWLILDDGLVFGTGYYSTDIDSELASECHVLSTSDVAQTCR